MIAMQQSICDLARPPRNEAFGQSFRDAEWAATTRSAMDRLIAAIKPPEDALSRVTVSQEPAPTAASSSCCNHDRDPSNHSNMGERRDRRREEPYPPYYPSKINRGKKH